jgi:hypothetical protein
LEQLSIERKHVGDQSFAGNPETQATFLDWARTLDDDDKDLTFDQLAEDSTAYLIPELWQDSDQQLVIESYYGVLFEEQMGGWWGMKLLGHRNGI